MKPHSCWPWWGLTVLWAALGLASQAAAQPSARAGSDMRCVSFGSGPLLECTAHLRRRDGTPLDGARVSLGAFMPSMPMAHSVKPVQATPTGHPGHYRATLELEMLGVWSVTVDISGPLRDKILHHFNVQECEGTPRCEAAPAQANPKSQAQPGSAHPRPR